MGGDVSIVEHTLGTWLRLFSLAAGEAEGRGEGGDNG